MEKKHEFEPVHIRAKDIKGEYRMFGLHRKWPYRLPPVRGFDCVRIYFFLPFFLLYNNFICNFMVQS